MLVLVFRDLFSYKKSVEQTMQICFTGCFFLFQDVHVFNIERPNLGYLTLENVSV